ncbi:hypothetical protein [Streptomyces sp. NPDC001930]|uniref:hypothetical protein n=1 Tax=Streptomyces sp. NPDC001930 TaxID=3364625 RepID=UPI0036C45C56
MPADQRHESDSPDSEFDRDVATLLGLSVEEVQRRRAEEVLKVSPEPSTQREWGVFDAKPDLSEESAKFLGKAKWRRR